MVAFKNLMIRITGNFCVMVYKPLMYGKHKGFVMNLVFHILKNGFKSVGLLLAHTSYVIGIALIMIVI